MILAFHGKLGSGKDTAGERMARMVDQPAIQISFARALKASAAALLDIDPLDWETYKNDPDVLIHLSVGYTTARGVDLDVEEPNVIRQFTAREFLQRYGTEAHREIFGSDFWVEQALSVVSHWNDFYYVTDCRFPNEATAIRKRGGYIVRVHGENEETGGHISEAGLPDELITFEIDNSVRGDSFFSLDQQLLSIASYLGLPLKETVFE